MKRFKSNPIISRDTFKEEKMTEVRAFKLSLFLLFSISITYFYWIGNSIFYYQENKSLFIFSIDYLQKYAIKPGGILEYAGNFLTQFFYNPGYGSLIVSSIIILFSFVFSRIVKRLNKDRSISIPFLLLPSCMLLLLQKNHDHSMHFNLGYLLVALWFLISIILEEKRNKTLILCLFPLFFYIVGSFALIYLGMYIVYYLVYKNNRYFVPVVLILVAFFTFILFKEFLFLQPLSLLLGYPLPVIDFSELPASLHLLNGYFILFPLVIKSPPLFRAEPKLEGLIRIATILTIFTITLTLIFRKNDPVMESVIDIEKSVYKQDWDAIIRKHESTPSRDVTGQYYYNLALAEKDLLCERLFYGRQDYGVESLALSRDYKFIDKAVYFYYTIGLISEVRHLAVESMVINGYRPENLKLLIKTELIYGNYKVSERFINILKKTLHYRNWAKKYEKMLFNPSLINSDPELGEKIKLLPEKDFFVMFNDMQNIEFILASNPDNKQAFEYKMARLLFEKDLEGIVSEVKKMKEMGYVNLPGHIEESILEYIHLYKAFPDLGGLKISSETELRFGKFIDYDLYKTGNKILTEEKMDTEWGNTFWFYYHFK